MSKTKSAKKAKRGSLRKKAHNQLWEKKIKDVVKDFKKNLEAKNPSKEALTGNLTSLQKAVDKAAKEKVIHVNKANRLKSRYAKKLSVRFAEKTSKAASKSRS